MIERVMHSEPSPPERTTWLTCATCGRRFVLEKSPAAPFCCERCRLIDMGRWLNEEIGLPFEGDPEDAEVEYRDAAAEE